MSTIKFYSDPHFGHELVIVLRGFDSIEEHDEFLIDQWNSVTNKRDMVWMLGDITMHKKTNYHLLDRLNGQKKIIMGNHDRVQDSAALLSKNSVLGIAGVVKIKVGDTKAFLSHVPVHPMEFNYGVGLNIHGHLHNGRVFIDEQDREGYITEKIDPRYICVSAERIDFKPKTFEELMEMEKKIDPILEVQRIHELAKKQTKLRDERPGSRRK